MPSKKFLLKFRRRKLDHPFHGQVFIGNKASDLRHSSEAVTKSVTEGSSDSKITEIVDNFCEHLLSFLNSSSDMLLMREMLHDVFPIMQMRGAIEGHSELIKERKRFQVYECDESAWPAVLLALKNRSQKFSFTQFLPPLLLSGAIAQYDAFLQRLLIEIYRTKPELLNKSERRLTFSELSEFPSIESARDYVLEKHIESIIRDSHLEQIKTIEKDLTVSLRKDLPALDTFLEACERRNCIIHNGGYVNSTYLNNLKRFSIKSQLKLGDRLDVNPNYLEDAVGSVFEIGFKLSQVLRRKFNVDKKEIAAADSSLINQPFYLIQIGEYQLAENILEYGFKYVKKWSEDTSRLIVLVNYANAVKLGGNKEKALEILDKEQWDSKESKFKICVAAIKDECAECLSLIKTHKDSSGISMSAIINWPVFEKLRENEEFLKGFEEIFGEPLFKSIANSAENIESSSTEKSTINAEVTSKDAFG